MNRFFILYSKILSVVKDILIVLLITGIDKFLSGRLENKK